MLSDLVKKSSIFRLGSSPQQRSISCAYFMSSMVTPEEKTPAISFSSCQLLIELFFKPPRKTSMSTFNKLTYHVVFSTKYRHPLIDVAFQTRLYEYIGESFVQKVVTSLKLEESKIIFICSQIYLHQKQFQILSVISKPMHQNG